jgi:hypothetical protein
MKCNTAVAAVLGALLAAPAAAQPLQPLRIELDYAGVLSPLHLPAEVKVLTLHVAEAAGPAAFDTHAVLRSYGILRALQRIDIESSAAGPVAAGEPRPHVFVFTADGKGGPKRTTITWERGGVSVVAPPRHGQGDPPVTMAEELAASDPLTHLSRAVYAASGDALCGHTWRFFDGAQLYELAFAAPEPASLSDRERGMGFSRAVRCQARYAEIAGFRHKPGARRDEGLKSAITASFGQLNADGPWVFTSMKADTMLGYAKVQLVGVRLSASAAGSSG